MLAFIIDSSEWSFDNWSREQMSSALDKLLERVAISRDRNETVWIGDDLQTRGVANGRDLWSLFDPSFELALPIDSNRSLQPGSRQLLATRMKQSGQMALRTRRFSLAKEDRVTILI